MFTVLAMAICLTIITLMFLVLNDQLHVFLGNADELPLSELIPEVIKHVIYYLCVFLFSVCMATFASNDIQLGLCFGYGPLLISAMIKVLLIYTGKKESILNLSK